MNNRKLNYLYYLANGEIGEIKCKSTRRPKEEKYCVYSPNGEITRKATQPVGTCFNEKLVAYDYHGYGYGYKDIDNNFHIVEYLYTYDEIKQMIKQNYKRDKILIVFSDEDEIYFCEYSLDNFLKYPHFLQINAKSNKIGIAFRAMSKYYNDYVNYADKCEVIHITTIRPYIEKALDTDRNCNMGNILEYFLSNNINDINENRFRDKVHDLYLKTTSKNGKTYKYSVELKTSINFSVSHIKDSKSASVTNNFCILEQI